MHEIKCPHCQKAFTVDEAGYADILNQVLGFKIDHQKVLVSKEKARGHHVLRKGDGVKMLPVA
jgi:hypothetical protein